jgi:TolB-like protein
MFTDIVGYSNLMGNDESEGLRILRINRKIHQTIIKKYSGKWHKEMGDGTLASFKTISNAIYCAGELINICNQENISLRIGIHFGEIVSERGDIFGDGVNIASRLEPLADKDQILVSGTVHQNIKNKPGVSSTYLKEVKLKNLEEPVKIYKISVQLSSEIKKKYIFPERSRRKILAYVIFILISLLLIYSLSDYKRFLKLDDPEDTEKSIAILPFKNLGSIVEHQYYLDGLVEDLITKLCYVKELRVISRTSSDQYRNTDKSLTDIGDELNAQYIVEGSGRIIENRFKITAQLIDSRSDHHIWAMDTVVVLNNILNIQNSIASEIVSFLKVNLTQQNRQALAQTLTDNLEAYEYYLKAVEADTSLTDGIKSLKKAVAIDPKFDHAWARLGKFYAWGSSYLGGSLLYLDSANYAIKRALEINPLNAEAYHAKAVIYQNIGNQDSIFYSAQKAIELGTASWSAYLWSSMYLKNKKQYEESALSLLKGLSRNLIYDPKNPDFYNLSAWIFMHGYDFKVTETIIDKGLELFPLKLFPESGVLINCMKFLSFHTKDLNNELKYSKVMYNIFPESSEHTLDYARSLFKNRQYEEAEKEYEKYIDNFKDYSIANGTYDYAVCLYELGFLKIRNKNIDEGKRLVNAYIDLRKNDKNYINYDLARCYIILGNQEEALTYLKKSNTYKIWLEYEDIIVNDMNTSREIKDFIYSKYVEYEKEKDHAREIFRDLYERLISAGQLKRVEDYL